MRLLSRVCAILAAGGTLTALAVVARPLLFWSDARLSAHLARRIDAVEDASGARLVQRLPVNSAAIEHLVAAAASTRQSVALAAQTRLEDWIASIERRKDALGGTDAATGSILFALADALSRQFDELGPASTEWAHRMCRSILDLIAVVPEPRRLELMQRCDTVLAARGLTSVDRAAPLVGPAPPTIGGADRGLLPAATSDRRMLRLVMRRGPLPTAPIVTDIAVAGVPDEVEAAAAPAGLGAARSAPRADGGPLVPKPAESDGAPQHGASVASGAALTWRASGEPPYARIAPRTSSAPAVIDVPTPAETQARERELLHAPLADVIDALNSEDRFESASAEAALRGRGMSPLDLHYARTLQHADAATRRKILEDIARQPEARLPAWLNYFSDDAAAEVRLRALTLLATSRDTAVLRQIHARAIRDEDPRIRALAEKLAPTER